MISCHSDEEAARDIVTAIEQQGVRTIAIRADLESVEEIESLFDTVEERFGRLDFFISNTAEAVFRPLMDVQPDDLDRIFYANVHAFVLGAQRAVRLMDHGGRVVLLSSWASRLAFQTGASLGAAHAAAEEWARHMALELAPRGVNVNILMSGVIESDSTVADSSTGLAAPLDTVIRRIPKGRLGFVEEVVDCALFLLSPASEYVTGATLVVDGGLTAGLPAFQP